MDRHSTNVMLKAERLLTEGRVVELPETSVYQVVGDTGTYMVVLVGGGAACLKVVGFGQGFEPCPSHGGCSHELAARRLRNSKNLAETDPFEGLN